MYICYEHSMNVSHIHIWLCYSLFINVPLDEIIYICVYMLYYIPLKLLSSPEKIILELMKLVTKWISVSFNSEIYRQIDGVSMGSPLGQNTVNNFAGFLKKKYSLISFRNIIAIYIMSMDLLFLFHHFKNGWRSFSYLKYFIALLSTRR